jgi:RHS repeat-associated protein
MGGVVNFVRVDHIGRPVFATNSTATKTWTASYLPFGEVRTTTGTPIALRFPGQWFQSESGLHQNWMRDYDPTTGRYLQADPLGLIDGANVYGYVRQNPGRYVDPRGEFGVLGALLGAGGSLGLQFGINLIYGEMNFWDAVKCVDLVAVTNSAIIGASGFGPLGLAGKRQFGAAFAWWGIGNQVNRAAPNIDIGDIVGESCDCQIKNAPEWVRWLKDSIL